MEDFVNVFSELLPALQDEVQQHAFVLKIFYIARFAGYCLIVFGLVGIYWPSIKRLKSPEQGGHALEVPKAPKSLEGNFGALFNLYMLKAQALRSQASLFGGLTLATTLGGLLIFYLLGEFSYEEKVNEMELVENFQSTLSNDSSESVELVEDFFDESSHELSDLIPRSWDETSSPAAHYYSSFSHRGNTMLHAARQGNVTDAYLAALQRLEEYPARVAEYHMETEVQNLSNKVALAAIVARNSADHAEALADLVEAESSKHLLESKIHRNLLIASIAGRIGVVVLILVFLKVLLSAYRYNVNLAIFFETRAYALLLAQEKKMPLGEASILLNPKELEFNDTKTTGSQIAEALAEKLKESFDIKAKLTA